MNIVDNSKAYALYLNAMARPKGRQRMRLLRLAELKFEKVQMWFVKISILIMNVFCRLLNQLQIIISLSIVLDVCSCHVLN
jgi:hypothetical protein